MTNKTPTIPVRFMWSSVSPDNRPYKPSTPVLTPMDVTIVVDVPLQSMFVRNAERILTQQVSNTGKVESPILTPDGMRYCITELENAMTNANMRSDFEQRDFGDGDNNDPWGSDE